uniref:Uncharacterized protein n=1 Tax=Gopherus evgoodei TaxID=1825980 RepID=A0A8C4WH23_9SAUR
LTLIHSVTVCERTLLGGISHKPHTRLPRPLHRTDPRLCRASHTDSFPGLKSNCLIFPLYLLADNYSSEFFLDSGSAGGETQRVRKTEPFSQVHLGDGEPRLRFWACPVSSASSNVKLPPEVSPSHTPRLLLKP